MSGLPLLDPALGIALRLGLALVFARAALHKLRDPQGFALSFAGYRLLPETWVGPFARGVPLVECGVALALLLGSRIGVPAALALLGAYTLAIGLNLARGRRDIDCGCAGPAGGQPLSGALVLRNLGLILLALLSGLPAELRALLWIDGVTIAGLGCGVALLHAATDVALANSAWVTRLREASRA